MIELLFIASFLHSFLFATACFTPTNISIIRTSIPANQLPYNTTLPQGGSVYYFPCLIEQNVPWFFPLLTMVLMLYGDYVLAIKSGTDLKINFIAVGVAFTVLAYAEVIGNLTTSNYFFIFDFITLIALLMMSLFGGGK